MCLLIGVVEAFKCRRAKHEHAAWAAAYALDPAYAQYDAEADTWRLQMTSLTSKQMDDAIGLVARLSRERVADVIREWEDLALHGVPGQTSRGKLLGAMTKRTNVSDKPGRADYALAAVERRRGWWSSMAEAYPALASAARRLLAVHVTSAAAERNWSAVGRHFTPGRASMGLTRGMKAVYVAVNNGAPHESMDRELILSIAGLSDDEDS